MILQTPYQKWKMLFFREKTRSKKGSFLTTFWPVLTPFWAFLLLFDKNRPEKVNKIKKTQKTRIFGKSEKCLFYQKRLKSIKLRPEMFKNVKKGDFHRFFIVFGPPKHLKMLKTRKSRKSRKSRKMTLLGKTSPPRVCRQKRSLFSQKWSFLTCFLTHFDRKTQKTRKSQFQQKKPKKHDFSLTQKWRFWLLSICHIRAKIIIFFIQICFFVKKTLKNVKKHVFLTSFGLKFL